MIDTTEEGDLGRPGVPKLRPYSETFDYSPLTEQDKLNVSINVYEKVRHNTVLSKHDYGFAPYLQTNPRQRFFSFRGQ